MLLRNAYHLFGVAALLHFAQIQNVSANPVDDESVNRFNELPRLVVERGVPGDREQLAANWGRFGLDLLAPATLDYVDRNFARLKGTMIEGQKPPHGPQARLQSWFRERASASDRKAMTEALRAWLTDPGTEPPIYGSMRTLGEREIERTQVLAAELLGDWRDRRAIPHIRRLRAKLKRNGDDRRNGTNQDWGYVLEQSIRRIEAPEKAEILLPLGGGRYRLQRSFSELDSMKYGMVDVWYDNPRNTMMKVEGEEARRVWQALESPGPSPGKPFHGGYNGNLVLTFHDGSKAQFCLRAEKIEYQDNAHSMRNPIEIDNPSLRAAIEALSTELAARR